MSDYVIELGMHRYGKLTKAQRTSSLFSEEPMVLGKRLRRGLPPMKVSSEQFEAHKHKLLRLEKAGSIKITRPGDAAPETDATPTPEEVVAQHEEDHQKELSASAGDPSTVAPAGDTAPAGAVPDAAATASTPDTAQVSDGGKVDSTEAPTLAEGPRKRRR